MFHVEQTPADLDDEGLLVAWDLATELAESSDNWDEVAELEAEVKRRGLE